MPLSKLLDTTADYFLGIGNSKKYKELKYFYRECVIGAKSRIGLEDLESNRTKKIFYRSAISLAELSLTYFGILNNNPELFSIVLTAESVRGISYVLDQKELNQELKSSRQERSLLKPQSWRELIEDIAKVRGFERKRE